MQLRLRKKAAAEVDGEDADVHEHSFHDHPEAAERELPAAAEAEQSKLGEDDRKREAPEVVRRDERRVGETRRVAAPLVEQDRREEHRDGDRDEDGVHGPVV